MSCQFGKQESHPVFDFYPEKRIFQDGYVNKFYRHYYPDNTNLEAGTEINYRKYQLIDKDYFRVERFNAAFDLQSFSVYKVSGDTVEVLESFDVENFTDTVANTIISPITSIWDDRAMPTYQMKYTFDEKEYLYTEKQVAVKDTTIDGRIGKIFTNSASYKMLETDSVISETSSRSYYVQGIGFFGSMSKTVDYKVQMELIEQLSLADFEERANHDMHRVAWIDPKKTMSNDQDFSICGHERKIADYYNSTPDGRYVHSKRALMDTISANLNEALLLNQSGRLVYRFVVNCEGKAGRFIAKGYDLDYQPMVFDKRTVEHLYDILKRLKEWRPVVIREESRDAYFYITFNIENGKIVHLLP